MLLWLMNLGFAGGGTPTPPVPPVAPTHICIPDRAEIVPTILARTTAAPVAHGRSSAVVSLQSRSMVVLEDCMPMSCPVDQPELGVFYSFSFPASGGTAPYTWTVSAGSLPPGLTLGRTTGVVSGTPTTAGSYPWTIRAADAIGRAATLSCTSVITSPCNVPAIPASPTDQPADEEIDGIYFYETVFNNTDGITVNRYLLSDGTLADSVPVAPYFTPGPGKSFVGGYITFDATYAYVGSMDQDNSSSTRTVVRIVKLLKSTLAQVGEVILYDQDPTFGVLRWFVAKLFMQGGNLFAIGSIPAGGPTFEDSYLTKIDPGPMAVLSTVSLPQNAAFSEGTVHADSAYIYVHARQPGSSTITRLYRFDPASLLTYSYLPLTFTDAYYGQKIAGDSSNVYAVQSGDTANQLAVVSKSLFAVTSQVTLNAASGHRAWGASLSNGFLYMYAVRAGVTAADRLVLAQFPVNNLADYHIYVCFTNGADMTLETGGLYYPFINPSDGHFFVPVAFSGFRYFKIFNSFYQEAP